MGARLKAKIDPQYFLLKFLLCGIVLCFCGISLYMVLLRALALCVYLCVGLLYIDIVYRTTVGYFTVCGCQLA